jgi:SEC-C motif
MAMNKQQSPVELTVDDLIDALFDLEDAVPRSIIDECVQRGDAMEQALIGLLDDEPGRDDFDPFFTEWPRLHAIMILGLFTSEAAGRAMVSALQAAADEQDDFLNDWLAGYWPALLRNKPVAVVAELREVADDSATNEYLRLVAVEVSLYTAQSQGSATLDQCLNWIAAFAANEQETPEFRLMMACHLLEFPRNNYRRVVESLAGRECVLGIMFAEADVERAFDEMKDDPEWNRFADPWNFYSAEAIAERLKRWNEELSDERLVDDEVPWDDAFELPPTHVRPEPKIGRNDPCPCGSGKKFKKCCAT